MSEDIIGNDRETFQYDHLDLVKLAQDTKNYYQFPTRSLLHNTILMIIYSRLNNVKSQEIKNKIYNSIGKEGKIELTSENFKFKDKTLLSYGLSHEQIDLIRKVLEISKTEKKEELNIKNLTKEELNIKNLTKIKGIGIWIIKALKIIMNDKLEEKEKNDNICFEQDYNVRNNLGLLYGYNKLVSETEAKKILNTWNDNKTIVSYFLWRLKKEAVFKILGFNELGEDLEDEEKELDFFDFIGNDR
jgi:3-methyladenine DNA glycosylase/8-oxoguanine DNA glycosylase